MAIGFRIFTERDLSSRDLLEAYGKLPAACVADCMSRNCALTSDIRPMTAISKPMIGQALTVKAHNGDNLLLSKAINIAGENDIVIVSNEGGRDRSLLGANMIYYAKARGATGLVVDGPIRDLDELDGLDWPIYATGATPGGPYKDGPGEINVPIACGGVVVHPGDIVLGDRDGVIVIPLRDAPGLLAAATAFAKDDASKLPLAKNGTLDRSWVDRTLEQKKCEILKRRYCDETDR